MDLEINSAVGQTVYDVSLTLVGGLVTGMLVVFRLNQSDAYFTGALIAAVASLVGLAVAVRAMSS